MADQTDGFNPSIAVLLADDDAYQIDFTGASGNFFRGNISAVSQLVASSAVNLDHPIMTLDIVRGSDARAGQYLKFQKFAGTLYGICQVFISWPQQDAVLPSGTLDFSKIPHATVAALFNTMNSVTLQQPVVYEQGIIYNGDLDFQITPTQYGAQGWLRVVTAQCTFRFATEN